MMKFCIFSYNRGLFLENLIRSILHCVEKPEIVVFDDNSDEAETCRILRDIEREHRVVRPDVTAGADRHGGLYHNMNLALSHIVGDDIVCFTQDDTQVIRKISADDIADIKNCFALNPNVAFLRPFFLKSGNYVVGKNVYWDENKQMYSHRKPVYYGDVTIAKVAALLENQWRFHSTEKENDETAGSLFEKSGNIKNPFLHFLPNPPVYRYKHKTFAIKMAEKYHHIGFYPFEIMSDADNRAFIGRDPGVLPIAEDFLLLRGQPTIKKPWKYAYGALHKGLKPLHQLEERLRRLF